MLSGPDQHPRERAALAGDTAPARETWPAGETSPAGGAGPAGETSPAPAAGLQRLLLLTADLVAQCTAALGELPQVLPAATGDQLRDLLGALGELSLLVDAAEVVVVADATSRGLHRTGSWPLPPAGWIAAHSRRYTSGAGAGRLARVAEAISPATTTRTAGPLAPGQDGATLGAAVRAGIAPIGCADIALTEMRRLLPDLSDGAAPAVWDGYAAVAAAGDLSQVRRLRPGMYARFGRPDALTAEQHAARDHARLSRGTTDNDGLTRYEMLLDPASVAILEAALDPLCAPRPGPHGEPDPRLPATRRAHALLEIVHRAVTATDTPGRPAAQINLIVTAADLHNTTGCATTITTLDAGRFLATATAHHLSCDAALTPILVNDHGTPIVIGRTRRLFTRTQIRALHLRDTHCTFPGCTRPANWSDAHHLHHWADGGATDLHNAALLCTDHHHTVHSRRLHGRLTHPPSSPPTIHWDTTPGSYDRHLTTLHNTPPTPQTDPQTDP